MKTKIYTQAEVNKIKVDEYNRGRKDKLPFAVIAMFASYSMVLLDKYGWSRDEAIDLAGKVDKQYQIINEGYATVDELIEALWEDYEIKFE